MKTYAIGHISFFDNELTIKVVYSDNMEDALREAFPDVARWMFEELNDLSDMKAAKQCAFNNDLMIDIVEVK